MGKRDKKQDNQVSKSKQIRSNKPKNKQMFTQLKTHEENKIYKNRLSSINTKRYVNHADQMEQQVSMEQQYNGNTDVNNAKSLEQVSAMVHHLLAKNKISAKNAFEVPLVDLEKLAGFQNVSNQDNGWKKISSTLQNDSKIYSYRVDAIHSIAYKIMNTMARNKDNDDDSDDKKKQKTNNQMDNMLQMKAFPLLEGIQMSTIQLQKNIDSLNTQNLSQGLDFNPSFERNKRKFDQSGSKSMLLNTINIDKNLELSLNQCRQQLPIWANQEQIAVKVDQLLQPLNILRQIQSIRKDLCQYSKQNFSYLKNIQATWRKIKAGQFEGQQIESQMEQEQNGQMNDNNECQIGVFKKVEDAIKIKKNSKKNYARTPAEFVQNQKHWLSEVDRKMLGIKSSAPVIAQQKRSQKAQKNQDDIQFEGPQIRRQDVFVEWLKSDEKNQYDQDIEDRHLLPPRPFNKFKIQQIMTLRQELIEEVQPVLQEPQQDMIYQKQRQQVDLRRQQISIRQSKDKIRGLIGKGSNFNEVMKNLASQKIFSQQLCFLTILHLANQNNFSLQQKGFDNFSIS